jgi:hypothetical protein
MAGRKVIMHHSSPTRRLRAIVLLEEKERCTIAGCNYSKTAPPNETIVDNIDKSMTTSGRH